MLETLDDRVFADLVDAYGPAVDVPSQLRRLATADREIAQNVLSDLGAGIFHQGSYYSATAPAIPFLVELAAAEIPARADVLLFLADMCGSGNDPELAFQPYLFHSTPGAPEYPEAIATIAAIKLGTPVFVAALGARDPQVRACAAQLLVGLGHAEAGERIEAALARETDPTTRMSLCFALSRLGRAAALPGPSQDILVDDVVRVLRVDGAFDDAALESVGRLLLLDKPFPRESLPFFDGDLVRFAAIALVHRGSANPRSFTVAQAALATRLARGEAIRDLPRPPANRICDPVPSPSTSFADYFTDVPLRTIAGAMASLAFGDRVHRPGLLRREALDARMREVLALTRDHGIPVPIAGAPWIDRTTMARFLAGGGPLDRELEWEGERVPVFVALKSLAQPLDEKSDPIERLFAELVRQWSAEDLLELAFDILDDGYGFAAYGAPLPSIQSALTKHVDPIAARFPERMAAYAERLLTHEDMTGAQAGFALATSIAAREPLDVRFDPLVRRAIAAAPDATRDWLATFPEPRRSHMVARLGNGWLLDKLGPVCERSTLDDAVIAEFLTPDCAWFEHEAERLIASIADTELLATWIRSTEGRRNTVLTRVLRARKRTGVFTLEMMVDHDEIHATLLDGQGTVVGEAILSFAPRVEELSPLIALCVAESEPLLELTGNIDSTTEYRVMRLLGEAGFRGQIQGSTGSSMRT